MPPSADFQNTRSDRDDPDTESGELAFERRLRQRLHSAHWIRWRLTAFAAVALIGCLVVFLLIGALAAQPALPLMLGGNSKGVLLLTSADGTPRAVRGLVDAEGRSIALDTLLLHPSARWLVGDAERARQAQQQDALAHALAGGSLQLMLDDGHAQRVDASRRGASGLGALFWLVSALGLALYLLAMIVVLVRPERRNGLYAVMALAQVGNLLFLAAESVPSLGLPVGFMRWDHDLRAIFDLVTGAALVHVTAIHPRQLPGGQARALLVWLATAALAAMITTNLLANSWWWTQAAMIGWGLVAVVQLARMQRVHPHPLAAVLLRFCALTAGTLLLLTLAFASAGPYIASSGPEVAIGAAGWVVFIASMLLMLPFLTRTQELMREFALLAGVGTVAISLDLLFAALLSLGSLASLTLTLFVALGVYAGLRHWLLTQPMARERVTTERMFEHLYRMAREVQARPQTVGDELVRLLRELFEPLEARQLARRGTRARVVGEGASLLVPVPPLAPDAAPSVIVLGFAQRGQRMFTAEDAQLADRVVDQLTRAVAFDQAVERGRIEERMRIAQDLHDDIGARLLTLMYQAPTREMEDYLRHTLKDLKTLTRGLAAPSHPLSHAVAEWKADIAQRLTAADCEFGWTFTYDRDIELSVVQWSALTRVLRELVSNAIAHAKPTHVDIDAALDGGVLTLSVIDNGLGREPESWAHGLGLGGVRKRVRQLGGSVQWRENGPHGIACSVTIAGLDSRST